MRKGWGTFIAALFIVLLTASFAFAVDLRANPFAESNELKDAKTAVIAIDKEGEELAKENKYLTQKKSDLDWTTGEWKKLTTRWENDVSQIKIEAPQLEQRLVSFDQVVLNYNSRCERTFHYPANQGPPPEYYACVNEKATLQGRQNNLIAERDRLLRRIDDNNKTKAQLQEGWRVTEEETMKWAARQKEYNFRVNEWNPRRDAAVARLAEIQKKSDDCDRAINTNNIEDMKAICGIQFDGNKTRPNPKLKPQRHGLTVTPNK